MMKFMLDEFLIRLKVSSLILTQLQTLILLSQKEEKTGIKSREMLTTDIIHE